MGAGRIDAILIAGANGAGKTTFARQFLHVRYPEATFLNADEIQRESNEFDHPFAAGRELLRRLSRLESLRRSFAIESTLSSRMYARRIVKWKSLGYRTQLHFIELPSADLALKRVAARVAAGGHDVPAEDVERRFQRGLALFRSEYSHLVHRCYHWKSDERGLTLAERRENP
ncbi:MAG: AAA family ATPase [Myxococcales bacterium]|nr:AAA family ATPase [Myxococcales bacterium]